MADRPITIRKPNPLPKTQVERPSQGQGRPVVDEPARWDGKP